MKGIRRTTLGGFGAEHYHIVYVDSDSGFAICAARDGHTHEIQYFPAVPEQPAQTDPNTGELIAEAVPAQTERFEILPAADGHTHDRIIKYRIKKIESGESDEDILRQTLELCREAYELEEPSLKQGDKALAYVRGDQWERWLKNRLDQESRACLTINLCAKYVNEIVGHEIQNRTDIRYLPQEDGDQRVADLLNILVKQLLNQCYFDREKTKVFRQAVITGRGVFNLYIDFSRNLEGEIKVECYPFREFKAGPHEKEDLSDCEYVVKDKYFSIGKLKQLYPDKKDDIDSRFANWSLPQSTSTVYQKDDYDVGLNRSVENVMPLTLGDIKLVDIAKREALVMEVWRKLYVEIPVAANPDYSCYQNLFGWEKEDIDAVKSLEGFDVVNRPGTKFRITKIGAGVVLKDDYCVDLPTDDFFCVPVYANKDGRYFWGKVADVMDAQNGVNKRYSQTIDIGNRMSSWVWFYEQNTFPDNELEKFKRNAATPGAVFEVNNVNHRPVKEEGTRFPTEIVQLMEMDKAVIGELMNISVAPRGANTSAQALMQEQKIRLTGNEFLFDGLSHALVKLGRMLIKMIQRYYTPDRIYRIVANAAKKKDAMIAGQPFSTYSEEELISLLETADLDQYDVEIAEAPNSPAAKLATEVMVQDLMNKGAPIPPEVLINASSLPDEQKTQINQSIQAQQEAQAQAEKEKYKTEKEKTLIAQGYLPPATAQEFGIQVPNTPSPEAMGPQGEFQNDPAQSGLAEFRG